jgi:hypothetical protein
MIRYNSSLILRMILEIYQYQLWKAVILPPLKELILYLA